MLQNIATQDSCIYKNVFARTNSVLATVEKADRVDILEDDGTTYISMGFHEEACTL